ncbi:hypothetical protein DERP_000797 [Dermatophagoides pteronyssinus]|uniref:Uncharacterized protein n=1 Tax=Dermatophagoides pteronyssinus TaxID=6956 RepID=A0ABQ8J164_DERPT|nr:hypothetical protein DERP_000797 [Dermatophagoides pteronyssinus]
MVNILREKKKYFMIHSVQVKYGTRAAIYFVIIREKKLARKQQSISLIKKDKISKIKIKKNIT